MNIQKAVFTFRGWRFIWEPESVFKNRHGRNETSWHVLIQRTNGSVPKKDRDYSYKVSLFTPSAAACRRIKKKILNKPVWKRKNITY